MRIKKYSLFIFLFILCITFTTHVYAQVSNAGFVKANIWYSKDSFEEGDKIKIYTVVYNPDSRELSGTVIFFDNSVFLGKKDFKIKGKEVIDVSIDWVVNAGSHTIFAKIENSKFLLSNGTYENVYLAENQSEKNSVTISKKIVTNTTNSIKETVNQGINKTATQAESIQQSIVNNTPEVISKPIVNTVNKIEVIRTDLNAQANDKKNEIKKEIELLEKGTSSTSATTKTTNTPITKNIQETTTTQTNTQESSSILKPMKYVEMFLLTCVSFILGNKIIFYGLCLFLIFLILRFIWNKFF